VTEARATDWDLYYRSAPFLSRFTRPVIHGAFLECLERYSIAHPAIAELGGSGSQVLERVRANLQPREYHVVDSNAYGLELLRPRLGAAVTLHLADVLQFRPDFAVDTVFSLGLIEHFDAAGTRQAVRAHLEMLKPGGVAVITFPTPTLAYRISRGISEAAGKWIFHDERPLEIPEVEAACEGLGTLIHSELIWTPLTQRMVVIKKA